MLFKFIVPSIEVLPKQHQMRLAGKKTKTKAKHNLIMSCSFGCQRYPQNTAWPPTELAIETERKKQKKREVTDFRAKQADKAASGILVLKIKKTQNYA